MTDPLRVGRVVGDVLDPFTKSVAMAVRYNSRDVTNGREFKPSQVANQPNVEIGGHDLRTFYTLSPRPSSGIHRLVFVLFRQMGRGTVYAPMWRQNFCTREFAELYNLGSPVAAVYYNCQRETGSGGRRIYLS
ncbi:hypothetical protein BHE74_00053807 [Ensete ventricosum]|uniref:Uncharacterized protein n=1 Tax=Ensete ventricosum TaxID=4639 RepID=A0A426X8I4_ENSVE|nr:hypothetical protein B296_00050733 [Ensete ventricosum]RWW40752.1 hypothetical protein BHE74_00053807 [Ensete ventricosum]